MNGWEKGPMKTDNAELEDMKQQPTIIGESVLLKTSLIGGFLITFASAVWWASGVQSDLNSIKTQLTRFSMMDGIGARVTMIEDVGPKACRDRFTSIYIELNKVQSEVDLMKLQLQNHIANPPQK